MSAPANLTGPLAKIVRAAELKKEFGTAFDQWIEEDPIGVKGRQDPDSDWFVMTFHILEPLPIRLGIIFGDMLNNLRGALDHLVWQLVLANGERPTSGNSFPVVRDVRQWPRSRQSKLKGVSDRCADGIKETQPFQSGRQAPFHWLALLNKMNNINKHRVIAPVLISQFEWEPTFELNRAAEAEDQRVDDQHPPAVGTALEDGQVLRRVKVVSPRGDLRITRIQKEIPANVGLGFDTGMDMQGRTFPDFIEFVRRVVSRFEPLLEH